MAETKTTIPVEIKMGNAGTNDANLPAFKEGSIIFTKDTKKIYIDPVGETERIAVGGTEVDLSGKQDKFCNISAIPAGMNNYILKLSDFGFWDEEQNKYHTLDADNQRIISISANGNSFDFREDVRVKGLSLDKGNGAILSFKPTDTNNHFEISSSDNSNVIFDIFKNSSLTMNMPTTTTNIPGFILNCGVGFTVTAQNFQLYSPYGRIHVGDGKNGDARIIGVKDGVSDNDAVNVSQLNSKQDKIGTLSTHKFESGGIARTLNLGGHTEDNLYIQNGTLVVDKFSVSNSSNNSFSIGTNAIFEENMKVGKTLVVSTIKASGDAGAAILTLGNGSVNISQANVLSFSNSAIISNVNAIQGNGSSLYAFAGSLGGSSFININNKKYVKIGDYNSGQKPISLLGISTPISAADTTLDITDTDLPYQAANKKYVDDSIATQISSVYKAKGSIAEISALPTPDKAHEGFVYNIENGFTTTDQFVEGAGKVYPAGTNVVCINTTGTTYKWDVLAGMVDLSNYATKTDLSGKQDKFATVTTENTIQTVKIGDDLSIVTSPNFGYSQISSTKILTLSGADSGSSYVSLRKTKLENNCDFDATQGYLRVRNDPLADDFAVNKKYVDDIKTELLNAITHPYTYDETTKELTLIL